MQGRTLEPGLLPTFRFYIVLSAIVPAIAWRAGERMLGIRGPLFEVLRSDLVFFVFLMIYTSWPWCREKMGRAFLPVALILKTLDPVVRGGERDFSARYEAIKASRSSNYNSRRDCKLSD